MKKLRRQRLLILMKVELSFITYYHTIMNYMIKKGVALSKPKLVRLSFRLDRHIVRIIYLKEQFDKMIEELREVQQTMQ